MGIRQRILSFSRFLKIFAFWAMMIALLLLCSQKVTNNSLMLSLLNYTLGKSNNLCASEFAKGISAWPILGEFMSEQDVATLWVTGRIALACDNSPAAYEALYPLTGIVENNPLLYQDVVIALSAGNDFKTLEDTYQRFPPPVQAVSDTLALAYINYTKDYETALRFRPDDLFVAYHLWLEAKDRSDFVQTGVYSDALNHFTSSAISPDNSYLFEHTIDVAPSLFQEGIWSQDKLKNVVGFWVWQYSNIDSVAKLLEDMVLLYPGDPTWNFYMAELYHRRGELVSAIEFYSNTLTLAPNYYYIHFRLGMVYEEMSLKHIENSEALLLSAIDQYKLYHEWAPRDLVVLEKLVELQEKIGYPKVDFQVELDSLVNLQAAVAEQLNVSEQQILIGPELLSSGSFLQTGGIINWRVSNMFNSHPFGEALYIVGVDTLDVSGKNYPGRIIGLWKR